ncbi:MAG TPA: hypothetical protein VKG05_03975, partial [Steroidobacteraceae bacterium]|nr:hypothetical protein [Steroidobacteraceae bacterium]
RIDVQDVSAIGGCRSAGPPAQATAEGLQPQRLEQAHARKRMIRQDISQGRRSAPGFGHDILTYREPERLHIQGA